MMSKFKNYNVGISEGQGKAFPVSTANCLTVVYKLTCQYSISTLIPVNVLHL